VECVFCCFFPSSLQPFRKSVGKVPSDLFLFFCSYHWNGLASKGHSLNSRWESDSWWDNVPVPQSPALPLPGSVIQEHPGHPGSRAWVATAMRLCIGWEQARASLWQDVGFPSSTSPSTWRDVAILVLPRWARQTHLQPDVAWGKVTLLWPSCPGQNKELLAGNAPKCGSQVLSRLFVTDHLVDFEDVRSGEIFEGSCEAFPCQMHTCFKRLKCASASSCCFVPRDGKEGWRGERKASFPRLSWEMEHPGAPSRPAGDVSRISPSVNP